VKCYSEPKCTSGLRTDCKFRGLSSCGYYQLYWGMKVAVFVPDDLFERADEVASRLGLNRSQLYTRAIQEFLDTQGEDPVTQRLDELADELGTGPGAGMGRRLIDHGVWEW